MGILKLLLLQVGNSWYPFRMACHAVCHPFACHSVQRFVWLLLV